MNLSGYSLSLWQEFSELLFPRRCLACGTLGLNLCENCKNEMQFSLTIRHLKNLPVYSAASFTPVARKILLSAKEDGIKTADCLIIDALKFVAFQGLPKRSIALQPIPSQKNRIRHSSSNIAVPSSISITSQQK